MGSISKGFSLLLVVILAVSSLMTVESVSAQSIPKPSVPDFSVKIISNPYLVPQTNSTDPYTGQVTIYPSYINENKSIVVTVKNQQFVSTQLSAGNWTNLYYNLRFEGHFIKNDWTYYPLAPESGYINASQMDYTVIPIPTYLLPATYSNGTQIDFQVQALIGYDEPRYAGFSTNTPEPVPIFIGYNFTGESSDWSPSETLVFGEPLNSTPTSSSSPTPTVPEVPSWTIPLLLSMMLATAGLLVYHKKHKHNSVKKV